MMQAPVFFFAHLVVVASGLMLSDPPIDGSDFRGVSAAASEGSTMAYDGKDWFFKVPEHHREHHQLVELTEWHAMSSCKIRPPQFYAFQGQSKEDRDLYNFFFCNKTNGTFVELGALNGVIFSNTRFFERSMGWSGLLIEASPASAAALRENRANPKNGILAEGVCPDGQGTMPFLVDGGSAMNGNPDTMNDVFKNQFHPVQNQKEIHVPCRSLSTQVGEFVRRAGVDHIDFFSLDVEGGELAVLQTYDFHVPVHCWVIEMDGTNPDKDEGVRQLLAQRGYVKYHTRPFSDRNEFWVLPQLDAAPK
jgi:FkbM family methyltransferase